VVKTDGSETVGYLFNRDRDAAVPFVAMFDLDGTGPISIQYAEIRTIRFTRPRHRGRQLLRGVASRQGSGEVRAAPPRRVRPHAAQGRVNASWS